MSHDHRSSIRLPLELLARLRWKGQAGDYREAEGRTANISGNGLFLTVPARLDPETPISFTVTFPPEITNTPIELVGQGRVVRSGQVGEPEGIAAIIDDYQLLPRNFDA